MQKQSGSKKGLIIIIVIVLLALGGYFMMSGTPQQSSDSLLVADPTLGGSPDANEVGGRVLTLLNQIKRINIDNKFFESRAFSSLVDHTVPIYEQAVGKANPFYNPHPPVKK